VALDTFSVLNGETVPGTCGSASLSDPCRSSSRTASLSAISHFQREGRIAHHPISEPNGVESAVDPEVSAEDHSAERVAGRAAHSPRGVVDAKPTRPLAELVEIYERLHREAQEGSTAITVKTAAGGSHAEESVRVPSIQSENVVDHVPRIGGGNADSGQAVFTGGETLLTWVENASSDSEGHAR